MLPPKVLEEVAGLNVLLFGSYWSLGAVQALLGVAASVTNIYYQPEPVVTYGDTVAMVPVKRLLASVKSDARKQMFHSLRRATEVDPELQRSEQFSSHRLLRHPSIITEYWDVLTKEVDGAFLAGLMRKCSGGSDGGMFQYFQAPGAKAMFDTSCGYIMLTCIGYPPASPADFSLVEETRKHVDIKFRHVYVEGYSAVLGCCDPETLNLRACLDVTVSEARTRGYPVACCMLHQTAPDGKQGTVLVFEAAEPGVDLYFVRERPYWGSHACTMYDWLVPVPEEGTSLEASIQS